MKFARSQCYPNGAGREKLAESAGSSYKAIIMPREDSMVSQQCK